MNHGADDYSPFAKQSPRVSALRECLFEFVRADHVRFRCELIDVGAYGVDVQVLRNEELFYSRLLSSRDLAIRWAEDERNAIEAYRADDPI